MERKQKSGRKTARVVVAALGAAVLACLLVCAWLAAAVRAALRPEPLPAPQGEALMAEQAMLDAAFPERTAAALSALPYELAAPDLAIHARSAIIVDTATGSILFERNADERIPPASLTKIVEMFVVLSEVERGAVSLDDEVPLPPQSWAENLPADASRMYLGQGQHVTLRELLLGLSIASGNDASIAVAYYVCGSMDDFVARMNGAVESLGLTKTHFVESSGYSELNVTTAREFATFAREYIRRFPSALAEFHAQPRLSYPLQRNLPAAERAAGNSRAITQRNTNALLGKIQGCDGLKTGFIYESGYNISVTAEQNGTRFLSVTLGGPGTGTAEGNEYRVADNLTLFGWAFGHFADYHAPRDGSHAFTVGVLGASEKAVRLVPALDETLTVPFITSDSPTGAAASVHAFADVPDCLYGAVERGAPYGTITYRIDGTVLRTVPLVADRSCAPAGPVARAFGKLAYLLAGAARRSVD